MQIMKPQTETLRTLLRYTGRGLSSSHGGLSSLENNSVLRHGKCINYQPLLLQHPRDGVGLDTCGLFFLCIMTVVLQLDKHTLPHLLVASCIFHDDA